LHVSEEGETITYVEFPDGTSVDEAFVTVTDPSGVWRAQSAAPAPSWVACSDPDLQDRFCMHYDAPSLPIPGLNA
jgi:hypothetical protein